MKKRILAILLMVMMIFGLVGCGAKEPEITGKWVMESDENCFLELYSDGTGIVRELNSDGNAEQYDFAWIAENGRIKFTMNFGLLGSASETIDYELTEKQLTLKYESGTIEVYNREEQLAEGKIKEMSSEELPSEEVTKELAEAQFVTFECMNEIKEASPESGMLQIYDMLFQYGCTVSEAIEIVENSQNTFALYHEYNENELILPGYYSKQIIFTYNDKWYFQFKAQNITDETISLKDCIITSITSEKGSQGNVFIGGYNENEPFTYDYIKNILMKDYEAYEHTSYSDSEKYIVMQYEIKENDTMWLTFVIEAKTGEVIKISIDKNRMSF